MRYFDLPGRMYLLLNINYGDHHLEETRALHTIGGLRNRKEVNEAYTQMLLKRSESIEWLNNQYVLAGYDTIEGLVKEGKALIREPLKDIMELEVIDNGLVKANWFGKRYTWTIYCDKDNEFKEE